MKHLMIVIGTLMLGIQVFHMMVGADDSLKSVAEEFMRYQIQRYSGG